MRWVKNYLKVRIFSQGFLDSQDVLRLDVLQHCDYNETLWHIKKKGNSCPMMRYPIF